MTDISKHGRLYRSKATVVAHERGPSLMTQSGGRFFLTDPQPSEVRLADIAVALCRVPRFAGQTTIRWTVAQHSKLVYDILRCWDADASVQLLGLLHDASEAYTGDFISPLKSIIPELRTIERQIQLVIELKLLDGYDISSSQRELVKLADNAAYWIERKYLTPKLSWQPDRLDDPFIAQWGELDWTSFQAPQFIRLARALGVRE